MLHKQDKFGIKFWLAVDAEAKYLFNSFLYLGKDESRDTSVSVPKYVVTKLIFKQLIFKQLIFKRGYNVTCDNFFTRLDVALHLANQKCNNMATVRQNRRELLKASKKSNSSTKLPCLHLLKQLLLL